MRGGRTGTSTLYGSRPREKWRRYSSTTAASAPPRLNGEKWATLGEGGGGLIGYSYSSCTLSILLPLPPPPLPPPFCSGGSHCATAAMAGWLAGWLFYPDRVFPAPATDTDTQGVVRNLVDPQRHLDDWRAVIACVRAAAAPSSPAKQGEEGGSPVFVGMDPARLALWGTRYRREEGIGEKRVPERRRY